MDALIAAIVNRTRNHPDIARGASVRGAIAFKEVLQSFEEMQDGLTQNSIEKAALITLPPRVSTKQGDYESAVAIISDIVREILYGIRFSGAEDETASPGEIDGLSAEDIMRSLQNPNQVPLEQNHGLTQEGQIAIIPDRDDHWNLREEYLKSNQFIQEGKASRYSSTTEAIGHLLEELTQKLLRDEITEGEYYQEKNKLEEMLNAVSQLQSQMSGKELTETVMELMDAQDKQWGKEISLESMFIYYHIKSTSEGKQLSSPKQGYYGLRVLIDELEKQGILTVTGTGKRFTLTARALDTLLESLIPKAKRGRQLRGMIDSGKVQISEHKYNIRRYSLGDVFTDISVRHTLREIARQKKDLGDVRRSDLRVFVKRHPKLQSDIMLCLDTSGSMGYRHKLTYARLAAAGLARAAVENKDRVGIVTFDDLGRAIMPLRDWKNGLLDYLAQINAGGNTNIGDGIRRAAQLLLQRPSRNEKYIVLITDGQPSAISQEAFDQIRPTPEDNAAEKDLSEEQAILETRRAASRGVKISVIHIANDKEAGEGFVKDIAKAGKGQMTRVSCLEDLRATIR
jgi:Mg-chelatase subunit ChlD